MPLTLPTERKRGRGDLAKIEDSEEKDIRKEAVDIRQEGQLHEMHLHKSKFGGNLPYRQVKKEKESASKYPEIEQ